MGLMGWLSGSSASTSFLDPADELAALKEATDQAAWVMNDEVIKAEATLEKGTSPFHKLGYGAALFWQAALGFDRTIMARARVALAEAETASAEHLKRAIKDPSTANQSKVYPPGTEYALSQAQCQLLGAILGILSESWKEGLVGVNKLRKAYLTLQGIVAAEEKSVAKLAAGMPVRHSEESDAFQDASEEPVTSSLRISKDGRPATNGSIRSAAPYQTSGKDTVDISTVT